MHAKAETQSPGSKPGMSHFPKILRPSSFSTPVADRSKIRSTPSQKDHKTHHQYAHQFNHHHISAFLISFLSHMFAPVAYQQCTSSANCWALSHDSECLSKSSSNAAITVNDEFMLLESEDKEQDGGPICRETTIESWKAPKKASKRNWDARRWSDLPYFGCP